MNSNGIQYFPLDVDIFDDPKVIPAICQFGEDAERVVMRLLFALYREGYCIEYNDALKFALAMRTRKDPQYIDQVIMSLVKYNFFDKDLFNQYNVLTSKGIQKRWIQATRKRSRKGFDYKCWLLPKFGEQPIEDEESGDQADELEKQAEVLQKQAEDSRPPTAQNRLSKVKKSKEEKELYISKLQKEFYDSLKPFIETYHKDTLRKFYDYWIEPNKSMTRLRWHTENTWDLSLRLKRWANNEFIPKGSSNEQPKTIKWTGKDTVPIVS